MIVPDVSVLVYAHRADVTDHGRYARWLETVLTYAPAIGLSDQVLSGFLRVVTRPRVFADPTPLAVALDFVGRLRGHERCLAVVPGDRHWAIFEQLCREVGARGNLIADAWFAALAIDSSTVWVTTDRDYARFPGLRWQHPLGSLQVNAT